MSVARHTAYNFIGAIVPIAVSLVTVPLYLKVIGLDRYGVLAICWLLVGYFGLFDFGLGRATAQKIATLANASSAERNRIFWTAALLSSALCLVAVTVFVPLATIGLKLMKLGDPGLRHEVNNALPLLIAAVPFGIAQSLLSGSLEGRREFFKINLIVSTGTIATAILPLLAAKWIDPSLPFLLGAALIARMVVLLLMVFACVRAVPLHKPHVSSSDEIRGLLHFGGWTTVTNVVGPLMVFWDRFAIGALLGAAAVAIYVVPFNLVLQILILPMALTSALFPKLASADSRESRRLSARAVAVLAFVMTPGTLLMVFAAPAFLAVWLGPALGTRTAPIACILLFGIWINSFARIPFAHIQARAKPKLIAYLMLAEILPYIGLLYFFMHWLGLPGAAVAWSLRCLVDTVGLFVLDKSPVKELASLATQASILLLAIVFSVVLPLWALARLLFTLAAVGAAICIVWRRRPPQVDQVAGRLFPFLLVLRPASRSSRDG